MNSSSWGRRLSPRTLPFLPSTPSVRPSLLRAAIDNGGVGALTSVFPLSSGTIVQGLRKHMLIALLVPSPTSRRRFLLFVRALPDTPCGGAVAFDKHCPVARRRPPLRRSQAQGAFRGRIPTIICKPMPNVGAVGGVVDQLLSLRSHGLLHAEMLQALVAPAAPKQSGCLHPHGPIQSWIVIKQVLLEVRSAAAPIYPKVIDQVGRSNVPGPHAHVPRKLQLLHGRVYELLARPAFLPSTQVLPSPPPRRPVTDDAAHLKDAIALAPCDVNHEVPPLQHVWEPISTEILDRSLLLVPKGLLPDPPDGDAAACDPWTQL
mmetsp:Transcript_22486/g.67386  ORF Transcript_22486/g.67386 Transcript_22486/m.67386 type:complete len:318 (+) Transcript_22486:179-1132(+)